MMDLSEAPAFVAAKMALLSDARATAATRADELTAQISDVRDRLNGRVWRQGVDAAEVLTVRWPKELHVLMAFLQPEVLVERLMAEINRIANTPYPLAEREQQIAELERDIDRLQRAEEAIVVATGAPREGGCPP